MQKHYTLLALGDSYTIGEAVLLQESFPYQTVQILRRGGYDFAAPETIARTGWTTEELTSALTGYTFSPKYDFVTLLIGVNNQYRGQDLIVYKEQFETLLKKSLELAGAKKEHVFVLSIPDYSVTPFAAARDIEKISKEIDEYNKLSKAICIQYKIPYVEITNGTREAKTKADLVAGDGLHPAASEYGRWAQKLADSIAKQLKK
jgi:lysophospholipase L1-like esterase